MKREDLVKDNIREGNCSRCEDFISRNWPFDDNIYKSPNGELECQSCHYNRIEKE